MAQTSSVGRGVSRFSWLKRMFTGAPNNDASIGARSAIGSRFATDDSASLSAADDGPLKAKGEQPPTRHGNELTDASIAQWLAETAKVQSFVGAARARVGKQMAGLQASIILAQDALSENDEVGRQALKKKIECAEQCHRLACQFNRTVDEVMRVAALTPPLAKIVDALRAQHSTYVVEPIADTPPVDPSLERAWITKQLTRAERELTQQGKRPERVSARQVSACIASLDAVVKLLTRQIDDIGNSLRRLAAVIDELDRFIVTT